MSQKEDKEEEEIELPERAEELFDKWNRIKKCANCGQLYTELTNIGRWACRYHPEEINMDHDGDNYPRGHYDFCGATNNYNSFWFESPEKIGCHFMDHSEYMTPYSMEYDDLVEIIPKDLWGFMDMERFPIHPKAILKPRDEKLKDPRGIVTEPKEEDYIFTVPLPFGEEDIFVPKNLPGREEYAFEIKEEETIASYLASSKSTAEEYTIVPYIVVFRASHIPDYDKIELINKKGGYNPVQKRGKSLYDW